MNGTPTGVIGLVGQSPFPYPITPGCLIYKSSSLDCRLSFEHRRIILQMSLSIPRLMSPVGTQAVQVHGSPTMTPI